MATLYLAFLLTPATAQAADDDCGNTAWNVLCSHRDNLTALNTITAPAWMVESELRGSFSILQTCILTLFTCIVTALHLNASSRTNYTAWLAKLKWAALSLIAPELVVISAATQFLEARHLSKELKDLQDKASDDTVDKNVRWTIIALFIEQGPRLNDSQFDFNLQYAFFVLMGGHRVRLADLSDILTYSDMDGDWHIKMKLRPTLDREMVQLTSFAVLELARSGHFVYTSPSVIKDRSKANGLQKALVVTQVSWLVVSCIARKVYGLPLTLLEIHTMVHVFFAFTMYMFWFQKPLDVQDGEILSWPEEWKEEIALLCQRSFYYFQNINLKVHAATDNITECVCLAVQGAEQRGSTGLGCEVSTTGTVHLALEFRKQDEKDTFLNDVDKHKATLRWHRATHALTKRGMSPDDIEQELYQRNMAMPRSYTSCFSDGGNLQLEREGDLQEEFEWYVEDALTDHDLTATLALAIFVAVSAIYGGVHATAWEYSFPTSAELLMWRISCIGITTVIPAYLLLAYIAHLIETLIYRVYLMKNKRPPLELIVQVEFYLQLFAWISFMSFFLFCRAFLVVESFISLRSVPIGVYWTPAWLQMLPHV